LARANMVEYTARSRNVTNTNAAVPTIRNRSWLSSLRCRYRLLCAEREDKKGDEWSKEMQAMRQHAL
jgi:hypothetical protein